MGTSQASHTKVSTRYRFFMGIRRRGPIGIFAGMNISRRHALMMGAAATGVALGVARPAAAAVPGTSRIQIRTPAGTFDALAAGPRNGRKVLLLHGFPESSAIWEHQLPALAAAGYRAVAPDLRGYSPGVRPARIGDYQLDHGVQDVRAIADTLRWRRFDLVGHDWGAAVAWIAAGDRRRIRSLTAVSVPHLAAFSDALEHDPDQQERSTYMERFRRPAPIPENEILAGGPPKLTGVPRAKCEEYFRRLSQPGALTAALNWYRANDFRGYRCPVAIPTLFLIGSVDPMVADSGIRSTRNWVTGRYRLERLAGINHFVPEQAAETTSGLLLDHLASVARSGE